MKIALVSTFICLAAALPNVRQVQNLNNANRIPGEFLVVLHPQAGRISNAQYAREVAAKIAGVSTKIHIVEFFDKLKSPILYVKTADEAVMSQLFQVPEVEIVESNLQEQMIQCSSQETGSRLWGLSRVSAVDQPDYSSASYSHNSTDGAGVNVYVHDTGVRLTHQDFRDRGEFGENFIDFNNEDQNGHGTHCAGTVLGTEFGVAKGANVIAVKVLGSSGIGSTYSVVSGLNWMVGDVEARGVRGVASISIQGGSSSAIDSAVNSADAADIPVVVAAGNFNVDACTFSPAGASGAITVGSTNIEDNLPYYSNWGSCVDILAPGDEILSASHRSDDGSIAFSGTSMACPHVAGLVAKYLSENPNASSSQVKAFLDSTATRDKIDLRGTVGTPNLLMHASCI